MCTHTQTHTHRPARIFRYAGYIHTTIHIHKYAHTKTCTKHIHRQAYSSPAFCIGDTFHYSKLLSGDVVCTLRGDMHSLQTRYTLIMHAQTTRIAFWCPCVCVSAHVCFGLACLIVSAYIWGMCTCPVCKHLQYTFVCICWHLNSWHLCVYTCTYWIHSLRVCPWEQMRICDRTCVKIWYYLQTSQNKSQAVN